MATEADNRPEVETLADLIEQLGDIPLERIRMRPPPGTATEEDVIAAEREPRKRLCELVDGVLVEKAMGSREALLAGEIARLLGNFVHKDDLGVVLPADGMLRLMPGLVRIPDVSYIPWKQIPNEEFPEAAIAGLVPDLAVEVLSKGNTKKEIQRKLRDYFLTGTRLVWVVQPKTETAQVYTSPTDFRRVGKNGSLDGGAVLPGFTLPLRDVFACTDRRRKKDG
jgi:Uma2 family endonuclease